MYRRTFAAALLLLVGASSIAAQIPSTSTSTADWTDFWGTIVNYQDGAAPSSNRRLHRHLLQSVTATATANATATAADDWSNVMNTLLSSNWSKLEPAALQSFNWSQLGDFEVTTPIADLLQDISGKGIPTSADEVKDDVDDILNAFCTPDKFTDSEDVPASCSGPVVVLALEPHECLLDDMTKEVTCKPAQITLTKTPGNCAHKSESAVEFDGKSCKVKKTLGFSKSSTQGGATQIIPLDFSKLTMTDDGDDSSATANSTATAGK